MQIVIPLEGRVRTVIRSSFVAAKRLAESQYTLSGDNFQMTGVTAEQVLILPDTVGVSEGQTVMDEMKMQALRSRVSLPSARGNPPCRAGLAAALRCGGRKAHG